MASNSGIKTLSRNKVLSNYFMYKFMKKNETKKSFGKFLSWRQLWCCCLMLIGGLLLTDRPAFSQATTQANVSLKLKQVTVLDALRELNRQYDRQLMFKREEVEQVKEPVSVDVKKVTLLQAVEACIRFGGNRPQRDYCHRSCAANHTSCFPGDSGYSEGRAGKSVAGGYD